MSKKMLGIRIDEEKARELKAFLAVKGISLQEFFEDYIDSVLTKKDSSKTNN